MMKNNIMILLFGLLLMSCNSEDSLQKYFVENSDKNDFTVLDISSENIFPENSIIRVKKDKDLKESPIKVNVLVYDKKNKEDYLAQNNRIQSILKQDKYQPLFRFNHKKMTGEADFIGEVDKIEEIVVYLNNSDRGLAVVRIFGDNLTPEGLYNRVKNISRNQSLKESLDKIISFN